MDIDLHSQNGKAESLPPVALPKRAALPAPQPISDEALASLVKIVGKERLQAAIDRAAA
jgi:hypothetical protein